MVAVVKIIMTPDNKADQRNLRLFNDYLKTRLRCLVLDQALTVTHLDEMCAQCTR